MEEKMEYQLEERTRDMQDLLESCQTRITKVELAQQQRELISMEGFDSSNIRECFMMASFVLNYFLICNYNEK